MTKMLMTNANLKIRNKVDDRTVSSIDEKDVAPDKIRIYPKSRR